MNSSVVTRFAPSPTGFKHVGNYRTALFDYIYAKQHGGSFIVRIEDTDKARNKKEYELNIYETLTWLGLVFDKTYIQSEHLESHTAWLHKLIESGHAYISKEEAKDGSGVIKELVRFKNPNTKVSFTDLIRGVVEIDTTDLGDFVIAKNVNEPLFHLAVIVDDFEEGVTHVLRGEDHISNTPRHVLIQQAIGAPTPVYAHLPLVSAPDKSKLSSRKGAVYPTMYRDRGYLPQALVNYMALIGWNPGGDQEIFTLDEIIKLFDLSKVQKGSGVFDEVKLQWFNKEHMKRLSEQEYLSYVLKFFPEQYKTLPEFTSTIDRLLPILRERISYFGELTVMDTAGELSYFFTDPTYEPSLLLCPEKLRKGKAVELKDLGIHISKVSELLAPLDTWTAESIKDAIWAYADQEGRGIVLWSMRAALSGKEKSPDPFNLAYIVGKEKTLKRLSKAVEYIK